MQLIEQHVISKADPRFAAIDAAAFAAKNLYNAATSLVRQAFIFEQRIQVAEAKARKVVLMLHHNERDALIFQERQQFRAAIIHAGSDLFHDFGNLIAFGRAVRE